MPETAVTDVEARSRLDELERRVATLPTTAAARPGLSHRSAGEWLRALADPATREAAVLEVRAYDGATLADGSTGRTGWIDKVLSFVDQQRPILNLFTTGPLPEIGNMIEYPYVDGTTDGTAEQAAEGDDLGYVEVSVESATSAVKTYGNYARLSRQTIERSDVAYLDAVLRAQALGYAKVTEARVRAVLAAAASTNTQAMGVTLANTTADGWITAAMDGAAAIEDNSPYGATAEFLLVARDVYKKLISFKDSAIVTTDYSGEDPEETVVPVGRPLFGLTGGGQTVNGLGEGMGLVNVGGQIGDLPILVGAKLANGQAWIGNKIAIETRENPGAPVSLDDENIVNLSKDFALYGYLASYVFDAKALTKITFA